MMKTIKRAGGSWHELFWCGVWFVWWWGVCYLFWIGGASAGVAIYSFFAAIMFFFGIPLWVVLYVREITRYVKHLWYQDEGECRHEND